MKHISRLYLQDNPLDFMIKVEKNGTMECTQNDNKRKIDNIDIKVSIKSTTVDVTCPLEGYFTIHHLDHQISSVELQLFRIE